jgi:hypothetical protein
MVNNKEKDEYIKKLESDVIERTAIESIKHEILNGDKIKEAKKQEAIELKREIIKFCREEICERRNYSASETFEVVIDFINQKFKEE